MTNKTQLQTNNTSLTTLIDRVNAAKEVASALPEAFAPAGTINITSNGTYDVKSYASASVEIAGGGGNTDIEDALITMTLSTYENNRVTTVGHHAFYYCPSLTSVNFPACISIGSYAFYGCATLQSVNFPICTSISSSAFVNCYKLTSVNFPKCTNMKQGVFAYCESLTSVNFPVCINIDKSTFYNCSKLTSVSFPACTSIGEGAFRICSSLQSASFPVCINIGSMYAFASCYKLSSLTLGASSVCTLANSNAFSSTPYAGYSKYFSGTPYIYVPSSLVASYKAATNWTYFSSYIKAIGGATSGDTITFTIDGLNPDLSTPSEYIAESEMTWEEWIESDYNIVGWCVDNDGYIADENEMGCIWKDSLNVVAPSDQIINGHVYSYGGYPSIF